MLVYVGYSGGFDAESFPPPIPHFLIIKKVSSDGKDIYYLETLGMRLKKYPGLIIPEVASFIDAE